MSSDAAPDGDDHAVGAGLDADAAGVTAVGLPDLEPGSTRHQWSRAALAVGEGTVAVLEEPIAYHDEEQPRGAHRLLLVGDD